MLLKISDIRFDSKYVIREINEDTLSEYADAISEGTVFPRPVVFFDGQSYWPGDGRHRTKARLKSGHADIEVEVRNGSERDAYIFGISANQKHGLRLTRSQKHSAVKELIEDEEWNQWSDSRIASHCGVSRTFVANCRSSLSCNKEASESELSVCHVDTDRKVKVIRDGKEYTQRTPAAKRKKREAETNCTAKFDWKKFNDLYVALFRKPDELGKIYNRHNVESARILRDNLALWKDEFIKWGEELEEEKLQCQS